MNDSIQIFDNLTGETIIREMTDAEQKQRNEEIAAALAAKEAKVLAEQQAAEKKAAALAKLEALGLEIDDLKAIGLG